MFIHRSGQKFTLQELLQPVVAELNAIHDVNVTLFPVDGLEANYIRGLVSTTGLYSCSRCFVRGSTEEYSKVHFPLKEKAAKRTTQSIRRTAHVLASNDLEVTPETREVRKGVKDTSPLLNLHGFDLVNDIPLDIMHLAHLGITRRIWVNMCSTKLAFRRDRARVIQMFDDLYVQTKLPTEIGKKTRPINYHKMKASEWQTLDLFCYPAFAQALPYPRMVRKVLLMYTFILRAVYSDDDVFFHIDSTINLQKMVTIFLREYAALFSVGAITFNPHSFSHLVDVRKRHGPVHLYSTNKFEGMYAKTRYSYYPNTPNVPKQILQVIDLVLT